MAKESPMECPTCGQSDNTGERYCPSCGAALFFDEQYEATIGTILDGVDFEQIPQFEQVLRSNVVAKTLEAAVTAHIQYAEQLEAERG